MVIAQLVVNKKKLGLQNFIVPIRDLVTHEVLPGVEVGDIGPKVGAVTISVPFEPATKRQLLLNNINLPIL